MPKIGIILGTTRPGRGGPQVAQWIEKAGGTHGDADVELIAWTEALSVFRQN